MVAPTPKQLADLSTADSNVQTKRTAYMNAYNTAKAAQGGVAVTMTAGSALATAWNALVTAEQARNDLLATYRAAGVSI